MCSKMTEMGRSPPNNILICKLKEDNSKELIFIPARVWTGTEFDIRKSTIHDVPKVIKYQLYNPSIAQGLQVGDFKKNFCNWYFGKCR